MSMETHRCHELLLALLAHYETPTASVEATRSAIYLRARGYDPVDYVGTKLPYGET